MLELFSSSPDAALQMLRSSGANCGVPQDVPKSCPAERYCKLPGGEVCVRAVNEVTPAATDTAGTAPSIHPMAALGSGLGLVLIGVAIGWVLRRR
jgi:hypothetical protein